MPFNYSFLYKAVHFSPRAYARIYVYIIMYSFLPFPTFFPADSIFLQKSIEKILPCRKKSVPLHPLSEKCDVPRLALRHFFSDCGEDFDMLEQGKTIQT